MSYLFFLVTNKSLIPGGVEGVETASNLLISTASDSTSF